MKQSKKDIKRPQFAVQAPSSNEDSHIDGL